MGRAMTVEGDLGSCLASLKTGSESKSTQEYGPIACWPSRDIQCCGSNMCKN